MISDASWILNGISLSYVAYKIQSNILCDILSSHSCLVSFDVTPFNLVDKDQCLE
jgi:hypothetical protein